MNRKDITIKKIYDLPGVAIPTDYNVKYNEESEKVAEKCRKLFGSPGRMLFASKSNGEKICEEKGCKFIPNANLFIESYKVWFGDVALDSSFKKKVQDLAKRYKKSFYVLWEMDGRFLDSVPTEEYLKSKAVWGECYNSAKEKSKL